jgi:hypothetical protein
MADNTVLNPGAAGDVISADEVATLNGSASSGVKVQRVKVGHGAEGDYKDATPTDPLPIAAYGELIEAIEAMRIAIQSLTRTVGQVQPDTAARMRVVVDAISGSLTLGTVSTVSNIGTLSTLTNQTQVGGLAATEQIPSLMRLGADSARRNISVS